MKNIYIIIYKKNLIKHISQSYRYSIFLRIIVSSYHTDTFMGTRTLKRIHTSLVLEKDSVGSLKFQPL
jgi:hypothetical protein